jgi:hypothetical protein
LGGHSGYTYTITPRFDGSTDVNVVNGLEGKNLNGVVAIVLRKASIEQKADHLKLRLQPRHIPLKEQPVHRPDLERHKVRE